MHIMGSFILPSLNGKIAQSHSFSQIRHKMQCKTMASGTAQWYRIGAYSYINDPRKLPGRGMTKAWVIILCI